MSADKAIRKSVLGYAEMGSFFENMAMMIKAGITVNEAAGLLKEETDRDNQLMVSTLTGLNDRMSVGTSFGDAMRETGTFPDYAVDMVSAAEPLKNSSHRSA